uniref:DNA methyltransferase n=1 Tax=Bacillus sp. STP3 TaxID=2338393 RepID=UPI0013DE0AF0
TKTVWSIANVSHEIHPATFPTEIPKRLTKLFSFWGETVLDPFGGGRLNGGCRDPGGTPDNLH